LVFIVSSRCELVSFLFASERVVVCFVVAVGCKRSGVEIEE
jgi:hypothetical protein